MENRQKELTTSQLITSVETGRFHEKSVYICLVSSGIGGSEKKMAEVWNHFYGRGFRNINFVISRHLYQLLAKIPSLNHLHESNANLIILECHSLVSFLKPLVKLAFKAKRGSIFHYPLQGIFGIHELLGHDVVISYNANNFFTEYTGGLRRKFLFFLRALFAKKIDVLNPDNIDKFRKIKITQNKLLLNPGSVFNLNEYKSHPEKNNWIVFCGRFAEKDPKNVLRYVDTIPAVARYLADKGLTKLTFYLLGYGHLEGELKRRLASEEYKDIDIIFRFENTPGIIMQHAKVFLSLQKYSNYPSRSLIEAIAYGNLPVVTDVGESRLLANESFSKYVSAQFDSEELAQAIFEILSLPEDEFLKKTHQARKFLQQKFVIQKQEEYYMKLYGLIKE